MTPGYIETLRTHDGKPDLLGRHLDRLAAAGVEFERADLELRIRTESLSRGGDAMIRIRGEANGVSYTFGDLPPHVAAQPALPVDLVSASVPGYAYPHKSAERDLHDSLLAAAEREGAFDSLIVDDGWVIETTRANLLISKGGQLITPPLGRCLPGITRAALLSIAPHFQIEPTERELTLDDLFSADEVMISNSLIGVRLVGAIDGKPLRESDAIATDLFDAFLRTWYRDST